MNESIYLIVPSHGDELSLKWDDTKYQGVVPTGEGKCNLLYGDHSLEVDMAASSLRQLIDSKSAGDHELDELRAKINGLQLSGNMFIHHSRPKAYHGGAFHGSAWHILYEVAWDLSPVLTRSNKIRRLEGTVRFNMVSEFTTRWPNGENWFPEIQTQRSITVPGVRVDASKARSRESIERAMYGIFENYHLGRLENYDSEYSGIFRVHSTGLRYLMFFSQGDYGHVMPVILDADPLQMILSGASLEMEIARYKDLGVRLNRIKTAEIEADAKVKAAKISSEARIQSATIQAVATIQAGYMVGSAVAMAGKTHGRWSRGIARS